MTDDDIGRIADELRHMTLSIPRYEAELRGLDSDSEKAERLKLFIYRTKRCIRYLNYKLESEMKRTLSDFTACVNTYA